MGLTNVVDLLIYTLRGLGVMRRQGSVARAEEQSYHGRASQCSEERYTPLPPDHIHIVRERKQLRDR